MYFVKRIKYETDHRSGNCRFISFVHRFGFGTRRVEKINFALLPLTYVRKCLLSILTTSREKERRMDDTRRKRERSTTALCNGGAFSHGTRRLRISRPATRRALSIARLRSARILFGLHMPKLHTVAHRRRSFYGMRRTNSKNVQDILKSRLSRTDVPPPLPAE